MYHKYLCFSLFIYLFIYFCISHLYIFRVTALKRLTVHASNAIIYSERPEFSTIFKVQSTLVDDVFGWPDRYTSSVILWLWVALSAQLCFFDFFSYLFSFFIYLFCCCCVFFIFTFLLSFLMMYIHTGLHHCKKKTDMFAFGSAASSVNVLWLYCKRFDCL